MATFFATTESRFLAIQTRNPLASHSFVYSVLTTKIYCRPTCPSRLARRANILFHNTASEAAADGFRACKRCRPDDSEGGLDQQVLMIRRACRLIEREEAGAAKGKWPVRALAKEVGLTESHFCRVFRKVTGVTVGEYRRSVQEIGNDNSQMAVMSGGIDSITPLRKTATQDVSLPKSGLSSALNSLDCFATSEFLGVSAFGDEFLECDLSTFQYEISGGMLPLSAREGSDDFSEFLDFGSPPPVEFSD